MLGRRQFTHILMLAPLAGLLAGPARAADRKALEAQLAKLERGSGGRLGVAVLDTGSGKRFGHRADERFPMCSTFKALLAAAVLARVDAGKEDLARRIIYGREALVDYSPVAEKHVGEPGLSVAELCKAAVTLSDNGAANLLLESLGGPAGLTAWLRTTGDTVTRLDRNEPDLNEGTPGDPRDTTTPTAMLETLQHLLLGNVLKASSRDQLKAWLLANQTGDARLRAGVPMDWKVGDKTGTGPKATGTSNDIAILYPPGRAPLLVTAYLTRATVSPEQRDKVLAEVGRLAAMFAAAP
ncbi:Beta-lactamase [Pseudomonas knackmussii B13]|uniref:Beta-lactamase n=1 Tax=Pseudomonas knackmussii (strain DSM 6978 / CCUG 54928 / LMG 23759 / B13) TaxID=1301098 RepID=A0A024HKE1_PSEKB|nr:class A beta-lactamase [Pseudomonas knackmussii]CDF85346.1 Beta-lactamase [Pseudomonas knackmussii B13]